MEKQASIGYRAKPVREAPRANSYSYPPIGDHAGSSPPTQTNRMAVIAGQHQDAITLHGSYLSDVMPPHDDSARLRPIRWTAKCSPSEGTPERVIA
jgi:hypothetical protein